MSEPISVRSVFRNELPRLLEMVHALAAFHGDQSTVTLDDLARDVLGNAPWYQVLVAVRGNALIGYAALCRIGQLQFGHRGMDLHHLFVEESHRRQGIGRKLMEAACTTAKSRNCRYMVVGSAIENTAAHATYRKVGFQDVVGGGKKFRLQFN